MIAAAALTLPAVVVALPVIFVFLSRVLRRKEPGCGPTR